MLVFHLDLAVRAMTFAMLSITFGNCVQSKIVDSPPVGGDSTPGAGGSSNTSGSGGFIITLDPNIPLIEPGNSSSITETVSCDGGADCTCPPFNVAVIGKPGKWGANPGGDSDKALQEWLNTSSVGTAKADNFTNRVAFTPEFLATYNVIILASLSDNLDMGPFWTFDAAEVAAFRDWVLQGGGVITLIGYSGDGAEVNPVNQLIEFSGISYNKDGIWTMCAGDHHVCACAHSNTLADWNRTDPVVANLSNSVTWVGLENGRSINAPADAHVAAKSSEGKNALVGKIVGKGHVLAYGDEWITYTSQWNGEGNPSGKDPDCVGFLPQDTFQTAQFWFNMIKWSQPSATCFKIENKQQPVIIW